MNLKKIIMFVLLAFGVASLVFIVIFAKSRQGIFGKSYDKYISNQTIELASAQNACLNETVQELISLEQNKTVRNVFFNMLRGDDYLRYYKDLDNYVRSLESCQKIQIADRNGLIVLSTEQSEMQAMKIRGTILDRILTHFGKSTKPMVLFINNKQFMTVYPHYEMQVSNIYTGLVMVYYSTERLLSKIKQENLTIPYSVDNMVFMASADKPNLDEIKEIVNKYRNNSYTNRDKHKSGIIGGLAKIGDIYYFYYPVGDKFIPFEALIFIFVNLIFLGLISFVIILTYKNEKNAPEEKYYRPTPEKTTMRSPIDSIRNDFDFDTPSSDKPARFNMPDQEELQDLVEDIDRDKTYPVEKANQGIEDMIMSDRASLLDMPAGDQTGDDEEFGSFGSLPSAKGEFQFDDYEEPKKDEFNFSDDRFGTESTDKNTEMFAQQDRILQGVDNDYDTGFKRPSFDSISDDEIDRSTVPDDIMSEYRDEEPTGDLDVDLSGVQNDEFNLEMPMSDDKTTDASFGDTGFGDKGFDDLDGFGEKAETAESFDESIGELSLESQETTTDFDLDGFGEKAETAESFDESIGELSLESQETATDFDLDGFGEKEETVESFDEPIGELSLEPQETATAFDLDEFKDAAIETPDHKIEGLDDFNNLPVAQDDSDAFEGFGQISNEKGFESMNDVPDFETPSFDEPSFAETPKVATEESQALDKPMDEFPEDIEELPEVRLEENEETPDLGNLDFVPEKDEDLNLDLMQEPMNDIQLETPTESELPDSFGDFDLNENAVEIGNIDLELDLNASGELSDSKGDSFDLDSIMEKVPDAQVVEDEDESITLDVNDLGNIDLEDTTPQLEMEETSVDLGEIQASDEGDFDLDAIMNKVPDAGIAEDDDDSITLDLNDLDGIDLEDTTSEAAPPLEMEETPVDIGEIPGASDEDFDLDAIMNKVPDAGITEDDDDSITLDLNDLNGIELDETIEEITPHMQTESEMETTDGEFDLDAIMNKVPDAGSNAEDDDSITLDLNDLDGIELDESSMEMEETPTDIREIPTPTDGDFDLDAIINKVPGTEAIDDDDDSITLDLNELNGIELDDTIEEITPQMQKENTAIDLQEMELPMNEDFDLDAIMNKVPDAGSADDDDDSITLDLNDLDGIELDETIETAPQMEMEETPVDIGEISPPTGESFDLDAIMNKVPSAEAMDDGDDSITLDLNDLDGIELDDTVEAAPQMEMEETPVDIGEIPGATEDFDLDSIMNKVPTATPIEDEDENITLDQNELEGLDLDFSAEDEIITVNIENDEIDSNEPELSEEEQNIKLEKKLLSEDTVHNNIHHTEEEKEVPIDMNALETMTNRVEQEETPVEIEAVAEKPKKAEPIDFAKLFMEPPVKISTIDNVEAYTEAAVDLATNNLNLSKIVVLKRDHDTFTPFKKYGFEKEINMTVNDPIFQKYLSQKKTLDIRGDLTKPHYLAERFSQKDLKALEEIMIVPIVKGNEVLGVAFYGRENGIEEPTSFKKSELHNLGFLQES